MKLDFRIENSVRIAGIAPDPLGTLDGGDFGLEFAPGAALLVAEQIAVVFTRDDEDLLELQREFFSASDAVMLENGPHVAFKVRIN